MRKKSHICLALLILNQLGERSDLRHKYAFCIGSILPDCVPSFLTTPHRMDCTYGLVQKKMRAFVEQNKALSGCNYRRTLQLGQIAHYIADYFTFPHNLHFEGNMLDHCRYEKALKQELKRYIRSGEAARLQLSTPTFATCEELSAYIEQRHLEYMQQASDIYKDVQYIVTVTLVVVASVLQTANKRALTPLLPWAYS